MFFSHIFKESSRYEPRTTLKGVIQIKFLTQAKHFCDSFKQIAHLDSPKQLRISPKETLIKQQKYREKQICAAQQVEKEEE